MRPKKDTATIIYTNQRTGLPKHEHRFANPHHFSGVREGVTKVVICGKWPKVVEAYRKVGAEIVLCDSVGRPLSDDAAARMPTPTTPAPEPADAPKAAPRPTQAATQAPALTAPEADNSDPRDRVDIPRTWQALPWNALRKIASRISGGTVINKPEAVAIVEAELTRRGVPLVAAA